MMIPAATVEDKHYKVTLYASGVVHIVDEALAEAGYPCEWHATSMTTRFGHVGDELDGLDFWLPGVSKTFHMTAPKGHFSDFLEAIKYL